MKNEFLNIISEIEAAIAESKRIKRFNLNDLIENEFSLIDVGQAKKFNISISEESFNLINAYLNNELSTCDYNRKNEIEEILCVVWHYRSIQEYCNDYRKQNKGMKNAFLHKIDFPSWTFNENGEDFDYESTKKMENIFSLYNSCSVKDIDEKRKIIKNCMNCLTKKQQIVCKKVLQNKTRTEISKELNCELSAVSKMIARIEERLRRIINEK